MLTKQSPFRAFVKKGIYGQIETGLFSIYGFLLTYFMARALEPDTFGHFNSSILVAQLAVTVIFNAVIQRTIIHSSQLQSIQFIRLRKCATTYVAALIFTTILFASGYFLATTDFDLMLVLVLLGYVLGYVLMDITRRLRLIIDGKFSVTGFFLPVILICLVWFLTRGIDTIPRPAIMAIGLSYFIGSILLLRGLGLRKSFPKRTSAIISGFAAGRSKFIAPIFSNIITFLAQKTPYLMLPFLGAAVDLANAAIWLSLFGLLNPLQAYLDNIVISRFFINNKTTPKRKILVVLNLYLILIVLLLGFSAIFLYAGAEIISFYGLAYTYSTEYVFLISILYVFSYVNRIGFWLVGIVERLPALDLNINYLGILTIIVGVIISILAPSFKTGLLLNILWQLISIASFVAVLRKSEFITIIQR